MYSKFDANRVLTNQELVDMLTEDATIGLTDQRPAKLRET